MATTDWSAYTDDELIANWCAQGLTEVWARVTLHQVRYLAGGLPPDAMCPPDQALQVVFMYCVVHHPGVQVVGLYEDADSYFAVLQLAADDTPPPDGWLLVDKRSAQPYVHPPDDARLDAATPVRWD
jgi:hypothetical protein